MDYKNFCAEWLKSWSGNEPEKLIAYYSKDAFYRDPARPEGLRGEELFKYLRKLLAANPNWVWELVELWPMTKGFCFKWKATIPQGMQTVIEYGLDIVEMDGDKISRNEVYFDASQLRI